MSTALKHALHGAEGSPVYFHGSRYAVMILPSAGSMT